MIRFSLAAALFVASATASFAEVPLSGDARMGLTGGKGLDTTFSSRARVTFALSGETDSGLSFGASFRADNAAGANAGTAGSVFLSGTFGKVTMGDVDGAAEMAVGQVAGVGFTDLGDRHKVTFYGAGGLNTFGHGVGLPPADPFETFDPTFLYSYEQGGLSGFLSMTKPEQGVASGLIITDAIAYSLGARYVMGNYVFGAGYENVRGFICGRAVGCVPVGATPPVLTDLHNVTASVEGTFGALKIKAIYGQLSGVYVGNAARTNVFSGRQYAVSATYSAGPWMTTAFVTDDSGYGSPVEAGRSAAFAYGLGASYDLGGGASVKGGLVRQRDDGFGGDATVFDAGISMAF